MTSKLGSEVEKRFDRRFSVVVVEGSDKQQEHLVAYREDVKEFLAQEIGRAREQLIDYTYNSGMATKMLKTPWGTLMWTPKKT